MTDMPVFIGWPNEGVEYWNAHWRHQARLGFFDDIREPSNTHSEADRRKAPTPEAPAG